MATLGKTTITDLNVLNNIKENGTNLSNKYVSKSGDTLTGNLTFNAANSADRFIMFDSTDSTKAFDWRISYLGSGSGDANYLAFQSSHGSTASNIKWTNALRLGLQTFDATFAGNILPSTNLATIPLSNTKMLL